MEIKRFYTEFAKQKGCEKILLLIAVTENDEKYVLGGNAHFPTELIAYDNCWYTKTE